MNDTSTSLDPVLAVAHRRLDERFGAVLHELARGDAAAATDAAMAFDDALRKHTAAEEELLLPLPRAGSLAPDLAETAAERLARELRLEHVQLRELSAMIVRHLAEKADLEAARRLCPGLARRWDAHTAREEREIAAGSLSELPDAREALRGRLEALSGG